MCIDSFIDLNIRANYEILLNKSQVKFAMCSKTIHGLWYEREENVLCSHRYKHSFTQVKHANGVYFFLKCDVIHLFLVIFIYAYLSIAPTNSYLCEFERSQVSNLEFKKYNKCLLNFNLRKKFC